MKDRLHKFYSKRKHQIELMKKASKLESENDQDQINFRNSLFHV